MIVRKIDQLLNVIIHNGRQNAVDVERMNEFDIKSISKKFYPTRDIDSSSLFEQFGDWCVDFTNVHVASDLILAFVEHGIHKIQNRWRINQE